MNFRTFERQLHAKKEWHQTIDQARSALRYDLSWSWEQRRQWEGRGCHYDNSKVNFEKLVTLAEKAVASIGFAGKVEIELYWMGCFYNDYKKLGLEAIKMWPPHWIEPKRVYPYIGWEVEFDPGTNVFTVRFHKDMPIDEIAGDLKHYKSMVTGIEKGKVSPDIHRAKVRTEVYIEKPEIWEQIKRAAAGELTFTQAVKDEYRRALEENIDRIKSDLAGLGRQRYLVKLRKDTKEMVRNRFKRRGLPTDFNRGNWWDAIEKEILGN
ncbi:hypothetical protein ACFLXL_00065 [Chloroflexota bacterium]